MAYYERRLNPTHLMSHLDNLDAHGMAGNLSLSKRSIQIRKPNRFYYQITLIPKLKASWTNETINFPAGCRKPRTSNPKKTDGKLEVHSKTPTLKQEGRGQAKKKREREKAQTSRVPQGSRREDVDEGKGKGEGEGEGSERAESNTATPTKAVNKSKWRARGGGGAERAKRCPKVAGQYNLSFK